MKRKGGIGEENSIDERIIHGLQKCWNECYKPRAGTLNQNLVQVILGYRCSQCVHYLDVKYAKPHHAGGQSGHLCLSFSPGVRIIADLMSKNHDFPFFLRRTGVVAHMDATELGAGVPLIWWEVHELMSHTATGTITTRIEGLLCHLWLQRAEKNLFGLMFEKREPFKTIREVILDRNDILTYDVTGVTPVAVSKKWWSETENDGEAACDVLAMESLIIGEFWRGVVRRRDLSDRLARWLAVCLRLFYGATLFVTGATALSLEQSAQVQPGHQPLLRVPIEHVDLQGTWFPVRHKYGNQEVQRIFEQAIDKATRVDLHLRNLESGFLEEQTTNSSGIPENLLAGLKKEIQQMVSLRNVHMITKVRQARIVDALITIDTKFTSMEEFIQGLNEPGKAGQRQQVERRPRIIQMVRTCQQLVGYLIRLVLKDIYMSSEFASTGKNVGDVRDMRVALEISSRPGFKSSNDIKGMDMSTRKPQVDFNFELAHVAFGQLQNQSLPCFFRESVTETNQVRVQVKKEGQVFSTLYGICQYILALGRQAFESRTIFADGHFQSEVETSARGFRSGWYPTSDNHNELGIETLEYIKNTLYKLDLEPLGVSPGQVEIQGAVAGDDQVLGVKVLGVTCPETIGKVSQLVIRRLTSLMESFGYSCDPSISAHSAEFLKQVGVCGAPELFPSRLLLFTAERGDTANVNMVGQIGVQMAMLREKVSRSPNSEGWIDFMISGVLTLGSLTLYQGPGGEVARKRYLGGKLGIRSETGKKIRRTPGHAQWCRVFEWKVTTKNGFGTATLAVPRLLWYNNHVQGLPPPPFRSVQGIQVPSGSQYTIPSTAVYWHLLQALKIDVNYDEVVERILLCGSGAEGAELMEKISRVLNNLGFDEWRQMDRDFLIQTLLARGGRIPLELEWSFRTELLDKLNCACGLWLAKKLPLVQRERPARNEPLFRGWQQTGNRLLDPRKSAKSGQAAEHLLCEYQIDIPRDMAYYNRAGARIDQALEVVTTVVQEQLEEDVKVFLLLSQQPAWQSYRDLFVSGWYDVVPSGSFVGPQHPVVYFRGWGHAVPGDSEVAWLINALGVPAIHEDSFSRLSHRFGDDLRLPGSADRYVALGKRCLRAGGDAYQLFLDVVGLNTRDGDRLAKYIRTKGQLYDHIPFAHNPRQTFFFGVDPEVISTRILVDYYPGGRKTQNHIFKTTCLTSIVSMLPGYIRPIVMENAESYHPFVIPSYSILLSPSLSAFLARAPRVPL
nr:MAG: RNA-dependent RNA polymerase [Reoviridae sp.]